MDSAMNSARGEEDLLLRRRRSSLDSGGHVTTKKPNIVDTIDRYRATRNRHPNEEGMISASPNTAMPASAASCKMDRIDLPFRSTPSLRSSSLSHQLIICQPKKGAVLKLAFRRIRSMRHPLEMQYSSVLPRSRSVLPVSESLMADADDGDIRV